MLQVEYDIKDATITTPGLSIIDPALSFAPVLLAYGHTSPYFLPPSNNALMIRPIQLLSGWPAATKFMAGDYGSPAGWEGQQVRASGDWFMHALSPVSMLSLSYTFPANTGWFVEFRAYALPKSLPEPIFDFAFGGHFQIIIGSGGKMDLFDENNGAESPPIASGNIANFNSFVNQDVQLMILPFRRSQILVWSVNRGGYIDAAVNVGADGNITEPCCPSAYRTVQPPAALVAITPLLYPADGLPAIQAPQIGLMTPLAQTPTFIGSVYDEPAETSLTLTAISTFTADPPVTQFLYEVGMAGNTGHQPPEDQGVLGIASPTTTASGDAVFAGGIYPYSLYTPFLYLSVIGYPRSLGATAYTNNGLVGILDAKLTLSKDRAAKSFTFTIDNPGNVTGIGANYTSLKDLQNRRTRAYLTNASLESGSFSNTDPDPDTGLIALYGGQRIYIFDGFGDQPEFTDGTNSRLQIRCLGLRKRLRNYIFPDQPHYDGLMHTVVVTDVLQRCGFVGPTDTEPTGLGLEIVCEPSADTLPAAVPGDEPLFTPAVGATAEEFLQKIIEYTGWVLDDLFVIGATNAAWYWVSPGYFAATIYEPLGSPAVSLGSTYASVLVAESEPLPDATRPNQGLGSLAAMDIPPPHQSLEELLANDIFVVGVDDFGRMIIAHARDENSISSRTAINYVGEVRTYILVSRSISTQASANQICATLYTNLTQARTHLTFTLPDFYPQIGIGAPLTINGYWAGIVDGIDVQLGALRHRKTTFSVLRNVS
jgi:hypothetical protein